MVTAGRSIRAALNAGTAYRADHPVYAKNGYFPPAAESPEDVLSCIRSSQARGLGFLNVPDGAEFTVYRLLPQSSIGCWFTEKVGTYRL